MKVSALPYPAVSFQEALILPVSEPNERLRKIYKATIAGIEKEITESQSRIAAERQRLAEKYQNKPVGEGTQSDEGLWIGTNKDFGKGKGGGGGSSSSSYTPSKQELQIMDYQLMISMLKMKILLD